MYEKFTDRARKIFQLANQVAQQFNHEYIGTEHVLLGLIKDGTGVAISVLLNRTVELSKVKIEIEGLLVPNAEMITLGKLPQTPLVKQLVEFAMHEARELGHNFVGTEHLLLAMLRQDEGIASTVLKRHKASYADSLQDIIGLLGRGTLKKADPPTKKTVVGKRLSDREKTRQKEGRKNLGTKIKTDDRLGIWSRSLTEAAGFQDASERQPLDEESFQRIIHTLLRRTKSNVLLVGDLHVAREYAAMVGHVSCHGPIPRPLLGIDVREFLPSAGNMQASLPSRLMHCLNECVQQGNVILVLDQLDSVLQTRVETAKENLGVLTRPWLRAPNVRCIGLIDNEGFQSTLATDGHVFDDFTIVNVPEFTRAQINSAVVARLDELEQHHICTFSDASVKTAIKAAVHYAQHSFTPNEVEGLLDAAAATLRATVNFESEDISQVEEELRAITRKKSAAQLAGDLEKAYAQETKFIELRRQRIGLGKLPEVQADQVIGAAAYAYALDAETVRKALD